MAVSVIGKSSGFTVRMNVGTEEKPVLAGHSLSGVRYGAEHNDALKAIGDKMIPLFDGSLYSMERSMIGIFDAA